MRILIADDNEIVRRGIKRLLSPEATWEICGEAIDVSETIRKARELLPDLILLDISMPGLGGLEAIRILRHEMPASKILAISHYDPVELLPRAIEAGAQGCVDKCRLASDLLVSIKKIEGLRQ